MKFKWFNLAVVIMILGSASFSTARVKLGTPVKVDLSYLLPLVAAEEKGFWKQEGVEVEWVPFRGGPELTRAFAAGSISLGMNFLSGAIIMFSRFPAIILAELGLSQEWWLWVRGDSHITGAGALKRARIGVTRHGSMGHAYARAVLKALGLEEKEVKIVASGGTMESLAALRTGALDVMGASLATMALVEYQGTVRRLVRISDYVAEDPIIVFATRQFIESEPQVVTRVIKALVRTVGFVVTDPLWAKETLKRERGYPEQVAGRVMDSLKGSWHVTEGRINVKRIQEVKDFLVEYELVSKEKTPPVSQLYTGRFVRAE